MIGLALCACGHLRDEHAAGGCSRVNAASKRFPESAPCACPRFAPSPKLDDAEAFLAKSLNAIVRKEGLSLEHADREDLLQVMRISLWGASRKYDSRSHIRFGSFAAFEVYNDAIDEIRSARMFGRQGQHRLPQLPTLEDGGTITPDRADPNVRAEEWGGDACGLLSAYATG